jgi:hypothetical protein
LQFDRPAKNAVGFLLRQASFLAAFARRKSLIAHPVGVYWRGAPSVHSPHVKVLPSRRIGLAVLWAIAGSPSCKANGMHQQELDSHVASNFWNDDIWNELLDYLEEGRVIPIIGPDLLQVMDGDTPILLDRYLARELAARCNLSTERLGTEPTLNDVVCRLLQSDRSASKPYSKIRDILKKNPFPPPRALCQLAEITHFNLFVSTTFDSLLEDALNRVRFGGRSETLSVAYTPNNVKDLDVQESWGRPTVYYCPPRQGCRCGRNGREAGCLSSQGGKSFVHGARRLY